MSRRNIDKLLPRINITSTKPDVDGLVTSVLEDLLSLGFIKEINNSISQKFSDAYLCVYMGGTYSFDMIDINAECYVTYDTLDDYYKYSFINRHAIRGSSARLCWANGVSIQYKLKYSKDVWSILDNQSKCPLDVFNDPSYVFQIHSPTININGLEYTETEAHSLINTHFQRKG